MIPFMILNSKKSETVELYKSKLIIVFNYEMKKKKGIFAEK
jgi:hypothetical protein